MTELRCTSRAVTTFQHAAHQALAITALGLSNFRSYAAVQLTTSGRPVVLTGNNGAGKTNVLDAISLFSPGRGLRSSSLADHVRKAPMGGETLWAISATLQRGTECYELGTSLVAGAGSAGTRQVRLNGASAHNSAELGELVQMAWLTPAMDRLFTDSASGRRRFLDRLTLGFFPSHAKTSLRYEKAMRERARLLNHGSRDRGWLDALERQMAEHGAAITEARSAAVAKLNAGLSERQGTTSFPAASLAVEGEIDGLLGRDSPGLVDIICEYLKSGRARDGDSGRTSFGPHISDLAVRHTTKRMDARNCSTGEQKALLVSIILAQARELSHIQEGFAPILLLDEIVAHLDATRRAALFEEILALGAQAWMTGTDSSMFSPLRSRADIFQVTDSHLTLISE